MFHAARRKLCASKLTNNLLPSDQITLARCFSTIAHQHKDDKLPKLKIKSMSKSDNEFIDQEAERMKEYASAAEKRAKFVTKVGAAANLALAISKGTLGYAISSTGLIADAANSLGDLLSDAVVYYSVTESRKRATPDRPWGMGKIEPLGILLSTLFFSCLFYRPYILYSM